MSLQLTVSVTRWWAGRDNATLTEPTSSHAKCLKTRSRPPVGYVLSMARSSKARDEIADRKQRSEDSTEEVNCQSSAFASRERLLISRFGYVAYVVLGEELHHRVSGRPTLAREFPTSDWPGGEPHHCRSGNGDGQCGNK